MQLNKTYSFFFYGFMKKENYDIKPISSRLTMNTVQQTEGIYDFPTEVAFYFIYMYFFNLIYIYYERVGRQ